MTEAYSEGLGLTPSTRLPADVTQCQREGRVARAR